MSGGAEGAGRATPAPPVLLSARPPRRSLAPPLNNTPAAFHNTLCPRSQRADVKNI